MIAACAVYKDINLAEGIIYSLFCFYNAFLVNHIALNGKSLAAKLIYFITYGFKL